jgi:hypothetical protein
MATRFATIKGIRFEDSFIDYASGGLAYVSFDLAGTIYTGGSDTVQLGAGGFDGTIAVPGSQTLSNVAQVNHRRDNRTLLFIAPVTGGVSYASGNQSTATNGPQIFAQGVAVSAGNCTLNLFSALTGGSAITCTAGAWERAVTIVLQYTLSPISSD